MTYSAASDRYDRMLYNRCGRSGLQLPAISLGLWWNFGDDRPIDTSRAIIRRAFDLGITHFDLANNYGPPYGSAEETFGQILRKDLARRRDEIVVSTKEAQRLLLALARQPFVHSLVYPLQGAVDRDRRRLEHLGGLPR
jgi:L-glyceraldehyde 3-phosphate reductase